MATASDTERPVLNDFDMHVNAVKFIDTTDITEPGDVPNNEIREILFKHDEIPDPIMDRSFLTFTELERSRNYFTSTMPLQHLRMEHDWAVSKRSFFLAVTGVISIILMIVQQEVVYDDDTRLYRVMETTPSVLKAVGSALTLIMLIQLWDLYDYYAIGMKKEWYTALYTNNADEGGKVLPRGILGTPALLYPFLAEFFLILWHVPPGLDFRYWCCREDPGNEGVKKPFLSDKWNMLIFWRLYLFIRVLRDQHMLYRRRYQIYAGGYKRRGGPDITYSTALRCLYAQNKPRFVVTLLILMCAIFTYMQFAAERDWQPKAFTFKSTAWFCLFSMLLCGYNGMFPKSTFGQTVMLGNLINGILNLSLAIEVIFGAMSMNSTEQWALDWLIEYEGKEKERDAATSYLAYWWRYAALSGEDPKKSGMTKDELQTKKTRLYTKAVGQFNNLRTQSSALASIENYAEDSSASDFERAERDLDAIMETLPASMVGTNDELNNRVNQMAEDQQKTLAQLDALLAT